MLLQAMGWASFTFIPGTSRVCRAQSKSTNEDASLQPSFLFLALVASPISRILHTGLSHPSGLGVHTQAVRPNLQIQARACPDPRSRLMAVWTGNSSIPGIVG